MPWQPGGHGPASGSGEQASKTYVHCVTTLRPVIIGPTCEPTQIFPHDVADDSLVSGGLRAFQRRADRLQTQRRWSTATLNVLVEAASGATWTPRGHRVAMAAALIIAMLLVLKMLPAASPTRAKHGIGQRNGCARSDNADAPQIARSGQRGVSLACAARCHCERLRPSGKVPRMADRSDDVW